MPDATITVNGVLHDWESITVTGPHGTFIGISEINWSSSQEKKHRYGKGGVSRGVGRGNYEPKGGATLDTDEFNRLTASLGGEYYRVKFPITITISPPDSEPEVVALKDCRINSVEDGAKQGDDNIPKKLVLCVGMISRNGIDEYS